MNLHQTCMRRSGWLESIGGVVSPAVGGKLPETRPAGDDAASTDGMHGVGPGTGVLTPPWRGIEYELRGAVMQDVEKAPASQAAPSNFRCNGRRAAAPVRFAAASWRHGAAELRS